MSKLGLGTAGFGRRLTRKEKLALLEEAFALGITYFDTAPLYGRGTAEEVVGEFAVGRRDEVKLATKLGMRWTGRVRRQVVRSFDVEAARASLAESLTALRTDRVDILLLHEPGSDDLRPELVEFLLETVESGRAGAVGIAAGASVLAPMLERTERFPEVIQTPTAELALLPPGLGRLVVAHTVLVPLLRRPDLADRASVPVEALPGLALRRALRLNPDGVVLFGTSSPEHLRADIATAHDGDPDELGRFERALESG